LRASTLHLVEAASFALSFAVERSPEEASGRYKRGWFIAVDDQPWTAALSVIPSGAQVMLTNREPYHRKVDTGGQVMRVPPGIVEATRQAVQRRFPGLQADRSFVAIPGGYVLKGRGRESGLRFDAKGGRWSRIHAPRPVRAKDRRASQALTYPALILSQRVR